MALVFKRILLVTHNVQFAIETKRALESLGEYEVTTVTDATNAIDRLRDQRHNLVILDIENLAMPAPEMITTIRKTQQDIAVVLAPDLPDVRDVADGADVQGIVDIPVPIRTLIPIVERSVRDVYDNLPETARAPAIDEQQETVYIETLVDELIGDDETPYFTSRQIRAQKRSLLETGEVDGTTQETNAIELIIESTSEGETMRYVPPASDDRSIQLFQKLAEEEPPMPGFKDSGTVSDLARTVTRSEVLEILNAGDGEIESQTSTPNDEEDSQSQPAILVLQTAMDETTPVHAISIERLIANIQDRLPEEKQNIRPLPSWLRESKKFITEPVFLQDNLPSLDSQRPIEYTSTLTQPSDRSIVVNNPNELDTEVIESNYNYSLDDIEEVVDISDLDADDIDDVSIADVDVVDREDLSDSVSDEPDDFVEVANEVFDPDAEHDDLDEESDVEESVAQIEALSEQSEQPESEDPYLTQLAVTLTQVTNDLTAEATILTRENVIVAYSGEMPIEDIEDIRVVIKDDWKTSTENARIRFITLPSSGRDYMLYSKGTVGGFTLSMAFVGTKQLRVIRRQGEKLLNALEEIPDTEDTANMIIEVEESPDNISPPEITTTSDAEQIQEIRLIPTFDEPTDIDDEPVDVGPKSPYTFIWLVDSFEVQLVENVAEQLVFWLQVQLNSLHWTIHKLDVHQDFIYLYADVPGDLSPSALIRNLMERSGKIARSEDDTLPENLWADAYLVLTPGREMTDREIQRFLNFGRGEL